MRIKKINDDKVQIIITNQDLEERDFKRWELMPLSPKAQELFQDLLDMAYQECGFEVDDESQLMVEAYPLSVDSFVVVMTKIRSGNSAEQNYLLPHQQEEEEDAAWNIERGAEQIWSFKDLEICSQACARIDPDFVEKSSLFKYQERYFLAVGIQPDYQTEVTALLGEYGEWVPFQDVFLEEYGKKLIGREAIVNMASMQR